MYSYKLLAVATFVAFIDPAAAISGVGIDMVYLGDNKYLAPRALLVNSCGQPIRQLVTTQFSFCLYVYIESDSQTNVVSLVSYSSREAGQYNEILLELEYGYKYTDFLVNAAGAKPGFKTLPPLNQWTHICFSWSSQTGRVVYYLDGAEVGQAEGVSTGVTVGAQGFLTLGQDQDGYNSGFEPETGLRGRITQFQMWDREITPNEVAQARRCRIQGNVVSWENSTWSFIDELQLRQTTSACSGASFSNC